MRLIPAVAAILCLVSRIGVCATPSAEPSRLGVGINVVGIQGDYQFTPAWRGELRYQTGNANSATGTISASVVGLRAYRLYRTQSTMRTYIGGEAAYVGADLYGGSYKVSGVAGGIFAGLEKRLSRRFWIGIDAGPYLFSVREKTTRVTDTHVDLILNSFLTCYIF